MRERTVLEHCAATSYFVPAPGVHRWWGEHVSGTVVLAILYRRGRIRFLRSDFATARRSLHRLHRRLHHRRRPLLRLRDTLCFTSVISSTPHLLLLFIYVLLFISLIVIVHLYVLLFILLIVILHLLDMFSSHVISVVMIYLWNYVITKVLNNLTIQKLDDEFDRHSMMKMAGFVKAMKPKKFSGVNHFVAHGSERTLSCLRET